MTSLSANAIRMLLLSAFILLLSSTWSFAQNLPVLGVAGSLKDDSIIKASGFTLTGTSVGSVLGPNITDEEFEANVKKIKAAKTKVYMLNVLFPGSVKIAGPEVDEKKVFDHLNFILARAQKAGIKNFVLGSGGARRLPDDFDKEKAKSDFILLGRKMAEAAQKHGVTIILESLNRTETNFINTLKEAADIVRKIDHPNFKLNADIYHMLKESESPQEIINAKDVIVYVEIAEKEKRTFPGVEKEDFVPYLKALKKIGYSGPLVIEARTSDLKADAAVAHEYLTSQLKSAYKQSIE